MKTRVEPLSSTTTRREFLQVAAGAAAATTLAGISVPHVHAAENNTINIALVGCGARGKGAAVNALSAAGGPVRVGALADAYPQRVEAAQQNLQKLFPENANVPAERCFDGLDAYRKAIDAVSPGGIVILATPPAFRPIHLEYAVEKGCHVFMEKSFAVDAPGIRRVLKAGEAAQQKNLKIAGGLMTRHLPAMEAAVEQIHNGLIGDVITTWAYRMHDPVPYTPKKPKQTELAHQIENYSCYTWLNGSFILDWLIHNLDVACWVKKSWPVSAQGQGGRQVRSVPDQLFDHYAVEYTFADGTRMFAQGRHLAGCFGFAGDVVHGSKGSAYVGESISQPRIYKGYSQDRGDVIWQYKGPGCNHYQREHELLLDAIRNDKPYNETEYSAKAAMTGILGRMAAESGQKITWDEAFNSQLELAPGLDKITSLDAPAPVMPDAEGHFPVAMPGVTKVV